MAETAEFPFLGHGPPKVPDHLALWLIAREVPGAERAEALSAMLPKPLREWVDTQNPDGVVAWYGDVLHVNLGMDVRYLVKTLGPEHLAWLPDEVSDADIERVLAEVMDGARKGPKAPSPSDWDLFGAIIAQWAQAVHARWPLWMVVVGRNVKPPATTRHDRAAKWIRTALDDVAARHAATLSALGPCPSSPGKVLARCDWFQRSHAAAGWGMHVVASHLADKSKPNEATREVLLQLLIGAGEDGVALASKLLGMWPKSQRPEAFARLLREGHELGLFLLAAPSTHKLLLDDAVYEAAMVPMPRRFSRNMSFHVNNRMVASKLGAEQSTWLRRMFAVAEVDGTLQGLADAEAPEERSQKNTLSSWLGLAELHRLHELHED